MNKLEEERLKKLEEERKNNPNAKLQDSDINFDFKENINNENNDFYKENGSFESNGKNLIDPKSKMMPKNRLSRIERDSSQNKMNNLGGNFYCLSQIKRIPI